MSDHVIHVCQFDSTSDIKRPTYEKIKTRILEAGMFSVFEATANPKVASIFTRLCRDPELVFDIESIGFPWTAVRRK